VRTPDHALTRARFVGVVGAALLLGACATATSSPSPSPSTTTSKSDTLPTRQVDAAQAQRLQRAMLPLVQAMDHPLQPSQVKIGLIDDANINAANAGGGQFYVTTGLLEKANDDQLQAVLAHEVAHQDLGHVAKAQVLGAGLSIGSIILDQIFPGSGALTPLAGELIARGYSRNEEYAADRHGVELLEKVGKSKQQMIDTLTWLTQTSGSSKGGFLATHPATGDRIQALREMK
jgi:Zn-dependent protease with chaperone function